MLTKAELSSGVERVRLYQESDRKFYVRVVDGAHVRKVEVEAVCHDAVVFSTCAAVSEDLQQYLQD